MQKDALPQKIETARLILRMFQESDWDDLHEMFSDEECVRYTVKTVLEKWQTWRTLASYLGHWQIKGYGPYAVVEKSSGKMIGPVGLWYPGDWPEPEIKWSLTKNPQTQQIIRAQYEMIAKSGFTAAETRNQTICKNIRENASHFSNEKVLSFSASPTNII
jgi:RimJ/RimL family protein N-acetyltransferase